MRLFEFGKGADITEPDKFPVLYHLCEYRSFSYAINNDVLKSRSNYVSTTYDEKMNSVVGKPHAIFKLVLDGKKLIDTYGAFHYDDSAIVIGRNSRRRVSHNEREIGIATKHISSLTDFLIGTVLVFDLFSETGLQWLLYTNPGQSSGFMQKEISPSPRAIDTLYHHAFVLKKPIWKRKVGESLTSKELHLLKEVYRVSKLDLPFTKALEHIAGKFPIVDLWKKQIDKETYVRRHMAPHMVKLLNTYFQSRRASSVDVSMVKKIITMSGRVSDDQAAVAPATGRRGRRRANLHVFDPEKIPHIRWKTYLHPSHLQL